jgi:hypothetical protein
MKSWIFVGGVGLALGSAVACGSSSGSGNFGAGDGGAEDANAADTAIGHDGAPHDATSDTARADASADTGAAEAGDVDASDDAQGNPDAPLCAAPQSKQGPTCDTCIAANCDAQWCACRNDTDSVDDAGVSGCLGYVACAEQCVAADAGTPTYCFKNVCATSAYTAAEQKEGQAFVGCLVQYCANECGP